MSHTVNFFYLLSIHCMIAVVWGQGLEKQYEKVFLGYFHTGSGVDGKTSLVLSALYCNL